VKAPLLILLSIMPDIDLLLGLTHRGSTHSLITYALLFLPILIAYKKAAVPYFAALTQHTLLGDYTAGPVMMLWPLTQRQYGLGFGMSGSLNIALEWVGFLTFLVLMQKTGDLKRLLMPHPVNLLLTVPMVEMLLHALFPFGNPLPIALAIPYLTCIGIFLISILIDLKQEAVKTWKSLTTKNPKIKLRHN